MIDGRMILLNGISLPFSAGDNEILTEAKKKMKRAGINTAPLHFRLYKKSFDARKKDDIRSVSSVLVSGFDENTAGANTLTELGASEYCEPELKVSYGNEKLKARPVIIGTGPAGMFCGLLLAKHGYSPLIIERGADVARRVAAVNRFYDSHILDTGSNIQFGAGGAGTFSDGKLVTRISDARCAYVLRTLYEYGAPESVLTRAKPHVGTDVLRVVVANILSDIERLGGNVKYDCRMDGLTESDGTININTTKGDMTAGALVLAPGHSARDTYSMLLSKGFLIEPKPFSVGVRIEHLQRDIDEALYGEHAGDPRLGPAEYTLSDTKSGRGVYTFCMCPGGEVVAAASEEGGLVVNGMSYMARDGKNANSAVAVSVGTGDYPGGAAGAVAFQRAIERAAFAAGGGEYRAPVETVGDFMARRAEHEPGRVIPSYMSGNVGIYDIDRIFPEFVSESLRRGLTIFGRKIKGFDAPDAVLTGVETRTSAPVRIIRTEDLTAPGHSLVYPCGEGAGYAGGITSSAVDGLRVAEAIMAKYAPVE